MTNETIFTLTELPESNTNPEWNSLLDHIILSKAAWDHYMTGSVAIEAPIGDGPHGPSDHYPVLLDLSYGADSRTFTPQ